MARIGATYEEIASALGCHYDTVRRRIKDEKCEFSKRYKKGAADIRKSLRRKQIEIAKKGNVAMLIWLGKNLLGQRDRERDDNERGDTTPIVINASDCK